MVKRSLSNPHQDKDLLEARQDALEISGTGNKTSLELDDVRSLEFDQELFEEGDKSSDLDSDDEEEVRLMGVI